MIKRLVAAISLVMVFGSFALAQNFNSQGSAGAPVAVATAVVKVLPARAGRKAWCIYPETVDIRCTWSSLTGASSPAPSATVGWLILHGLGGGRCENPVPPTAYKTNNTGEEVDCFVATGSSATNVDTIEY